MKKSLLLTAAVAVASLSAFATTSITEGTEYYIRNVKTGMWMNGGYSWGTKGIVKPQARAFTFEASGDGYKLHSSVGYVKPGGEIYLDGGSASDGGVYNVALENGYFTFTDNNGYMTLEQNSDNEIFMLTYGDAYDAGLIDDSWESWLGALQSYDFYPIRCANYTNDDARYWELLTMEEMLAELSSASENNPVEATFLIKAFMLDRNDADNETAWQTTLNGENIELVFPSYGWGFHVENYTEWAIAGTYGWFDHDDTEGTGVVSQVAEGCPAGNYKVYYHVVDQPNTPFSLTFNGTEAEVSEFVNEDGVSVDLWYQTATGVLANREQVKEATFTVGQDGKLAIVMTKECKDGEQNRFAFKSFILKYMGPTTTGVEGIATDTNAPVEYYNIQGVRIAEPSNGIFIVKQGNKVTKKVIR